MPGAGIGDGEGMVLARLSNGVVQLTSECLAERS